MSHAVQSMVLPAKPNTSRIFAAIAATLLTAALVACVLYMFRTNRPASPRSPVAVGTSEPVKRVEGGLAVSRVPAVSRAPAVNAVVTPRLDVSNLPEQPQAKLADEDRYLWRTIHAERFDESNSAKVEPGWVSSLDPGDWVSFKKIDFGSGASHFVGRIAVHPDFAGSSVEVRIDRVDGPVVATLKTQATVDFFNFTEQMAELTERPQGVHDVYLTFAGGKSVCNIDWIKFIRTPRLGFQEIDAQSYDLLKGVTDRAAWLEFIDEGDVIRFSGIDFEQGASSVKLRMAVPEKDAGKTLEVRIDRADGPMIASIVATATGSWHDFATHQAAFDAPVTGVHDVFLTFKGKRVCNLDWIRFEK